MIARDPRSAESLALHLWHRATPSAMLPLEPERQAELADLRVVERSEGGRRNVRLRVGRREAVERVEGVDDDPRLPLEDLQPPLDAQLDLQRVREAQRVPLAA